MGFLTRASTVDIINLSFLLINTAFYLFTINRTPYRTHLPPIYLTLFLIVFLMGRFRASEIPLRLKRLLLFIYPVLFLFAIFETFFMLVPYFNPMRFDDVLIKADYAVFGFHPTVRIESWASPLLTELMYVLYFFYFPMPMIVLVLMYRRGRFKDIERAFLTFLACYYGSYIVYFFVPASGPRFHLGELQSVRLRGYILTEPINDFINILELNKLDAFPSLHAAIVLTTMLITLKENRTLFCIFMPLAAGVAVSLIYCRYHYVVDVLAGLLWAGISYPLSGKIYRGLMKRCVPHFGEAS